MDDAIAAANELMRKLKAAREQGATKVSCALSARTEYVAETTAMRLCIERLAPFRKGRPITFDLPDIEMASDITKAFCMIAKAMAAGELTPDQAGTVATVIEAHRKAIEMAEFEGRLRKLDARLYQ
jgi:hypothetical protein